MSHEPYYLHLIILSSSAALRSWIFLAKSCLSSLSVKNAQNQVIISRNAHVNIIRFLRPSPQELGEYICGASGPLGEKAKVYMARAPKRSRRIGAVASLIGRMGRKE